MPALLLVATLFVALAQAAPSVDDREAAKAHTKRALVAYNLGNFDEAALEYEAAYRLIQDPVLLFNIAQSYRLGGRPEKALAAYKGFLRTAPADAPNRAAVEARVAELERTVAEQKRVAEPPAPAAAPGPATPPPAAGPAPAPTVAPTPAAPPPPASPPSTAVAATTPPAPAPPAPPRSIVTGAGLHVRLTGNEDANGNELRGFGRLTDRSLRTWELGYHRRSIYPMLPDFQMTSIYASLATAGGWLVDVGAPAGTRDWHVGLGTRSEYLTLVARAEHADAEELCGTTDGSLLYGVADGRIQVPVTGRFTARGSAVYRGKIARLNRCAFHPSLLSLEMGADLALGSSWLLSGAFGLHSFYDFGGATPAAWPERDSAVGQGSLGARYAVGRVRLFTLVRQVGYNQGMIQFELGIEVRSAPDAP